MGRSRIKKALLVIVIVIAIVFVLSVIFRLSERPLGEKIGVIEIEGIIADSKSTMDEIVKFKDDDSIKGVILRINSPGGSVAPTQEIFKEIKKLRQKKKVYTSMASVCASGGYYIAAAGEKIFANPSTITGSIGVIMEQAVIEDLLKKIGIQTNTLKAGELKDAGSPFRKMTKEERLYLNSLLKDVHEQFIKDIAEARKMNIDAARNISDGRIYTGSKAMKLGLVDAIGTFYDTIDDLKTALNIKGKPQLVYTKKPFSFFKMLSGAISKEISLRLFSEPIRYEYRP